MPSDPSHRDAWALDPRTVYLNHGSFGPPPRAVQDAVAEIRRRIDANPMRYFKEELGPALRTATERLGAELGADPADLVFCDNATVAVNIVAESFPLAPGDEVLANDHEYGATLRIWRRACERAGATLVVRPLPVPLRHTEGVVAELLAGAGPRTKLLVVSHITSPTALRLPVEELVPAAQARGIAVCIDGPHAVALEPLALASLGADYYAASCHKWLCGPFGSGFLHVRRDRQAAVRPPHLSWGNPFPGMAPSWQDEFHWPGTRDFAAWIGLPAAFDFLDAPRLAELRGPCRLRAIETGDRWCARFGGVPLAPAASPFRTNMTTVPLPPGDPDRLHRLLRERAGIEIPVFEWNGRRHVRLSSHLYNTPAEYALAEETLAELLKAGF